MWTANDSACMFLKSYQRWGKTYSKRVSMLVPRDRGGAWKYEGRFYGLGLEASQVTFDINCKCSSKDFEGYVNANRPLAPILSGIVLGIATSTSPPEISTSSSVEMLSAHASFSTGWILMSKNTSVADSTAQDPLLLHTLAILQLS